MESFGAEDETRTRDPDLGKVVLYQLSYFRILLRPFCPFWECKDNSVEHKNKFFFAVFRKNIFDILFCAKAFPMSNLAEGGGCAQPAIPGLGVWFYRATAAGSCPRIIRLLLLPLPEYGCCGIYLPH